MAVPRRTRALLFAVFAIGLGIGLRVLAARGDLWFDEILSIHLADRAEGALDVFLAPALRHDNNHPLNTFALWWLGDRLGGAGLRAPAVVLACLGLPVAWAIGRRRSPLEGSAAVLLFAVSGVMVQYGSEARGYAGAVTCALLAIHAIEGARDRPSRWKGPVLYGLSVTAGVAFHLSFVQLQAATVLWWLARFASVGDRREVARLALLWHAVPATVSIGALALFGARMAVAGGPDTDLARAIATAAAVSLGLPTGDSWLVAGVVLLAAIVAAAVALAHRRGDDRWVLWAAGLVGVPGLLIAIHSPAYVAPRYFLMSTTVLLLLLASLFAIGWRAGGAVRVGAVAALAAFLVGSAVQSGALLRDGRGHYGDAVLAIAAQSVEHPATVGSDHEVQCAALLGYHAARVRPEGGVVLLPRDAWPPGGPEWMLRYGFGARPTLPHRFQLEGTAPYVLAQHFPRAPLSGWHWFLYRREDRREDRFEDGNRRGSWAQGAAAASRQSAVP